MIPLPDPTPPRLLEKLSGEINMLAPTALHEYARDSWQRSVLFLDILRQRGNQREEMLAHGISSVLIYDSELVMRGDQLPNPVNYSLLRVIPPEGAEIDNRKRPVFVIDPRAGHSRAACAHRRASEGHGAGPFWRSAMWQALRRHEAKSQPLLLADARP